MRCTPKSSWPRIDRTVLDAVAEPAVSWAEISPYIAKGLTYPQIAEVFNCTTADVFRAAARPN